MPEPSSEGLRRKLTILADARADLRRVAEHSGRLRV